MELLGLFFLGVPVSVLVLYVLFTNLDNTNANKKFDDTNSDNSFWR